MVVLHEGSRVLHLERSWASSDQTFYRPAPSGSRAGFAAGPVIHPP